MPNKKKNKSTAIMQNYKSNLKYIQNAFCFYRDFFLRP